MLFKKDERSKFEFLSIKEFILSIVLMGFNLIFFILIIPSILSAILPQNTGLYESMSFRTILSYPSLLLNFYVIYLFVCKMKRKSLKEGFYFIPQNNRVYIKSIFVGILMPVITSPILLKCAPEDFYAQDMISGGGLILVIIGALLAPVLEEVFYRGYIFPFFQSKLNSFWGIVIASLFFGLSHYMNIGNTNILVCLFIFYGVVLTLARYFTGSLIPSIIIHMSHNLTLILGFIIGKYLNLFH